MSTISVVLSAVTGTLFISTGLVKVIGVRQSLAVRDHFGMPATLWRTVGLLESAGGVGVLVGLKVTWLGLLALTGLALLMLGAIVSRLRVRDPALLIVGDVAVLGLVVATAITSLAK